MIYLALGAFLLLLWMWLRSPAVRRGGWRIGAGLAATALVVVGASLAIRGDAVIGLPVVALGIGLAVAGRLNRDLRRTSPPPAQSGDGGMSAAEARSILGVEASASAEQIRSAYNRLMQRAHPDKGGTAGLAAQLNAARDRLLKG